MQAGRLPQAQGRHMTAADELDAAMLAIAKGERVEEPDR